jgi:hypothetical protein
MIDHPFLQSSGLISQLEQANVTDSNRGPVLEPIQEASVDNILDESSEQAKLDKAMEDIIMLF